MLISPLSIVLGLLPYEHGSSFPGLLIKLIISIVPISARIPLQFLFTSIYCDLISYYLTCFPIFYFL